MPNIIAMKWGLALAQVQELLFGTLFGFFLDAMPKHISRVGGLLTALGARW